jgi:RHS repeat-associated protein
LRGEGLGNRVGSRSTGKERDSETQLDYFGARYYGNSLGRFITPDWAAKPVTVPYSNLGNPQSLNLYSYVSNNPMTLADADGHEAGLTYNHDGSITSPVDAKTDGHPIRDTLALGALTAVSLASPEAIPLFRNLLGIGLAAASTPGGQQVLNETAEAISNPLPAPSLTSAFGIGKVESVYEGFSVGRFSNGAEIAAKITTSGENTTVSVLGAFNAGGGKSVAGTLSAIEKGATAAAEKAGSSSLTLQAVAVTNPKLAKLLTKQGFTKTTVKVGKDTVDAFQKTIKIKKTQ